jgi:NAD(P)-dependent dehydrogenase (short-subunit alcohol dehydrogenase family)
VLGAASGIGKSSAEALAGLGARVLCADRNEATAAGIREAGSWAEAITTDGALAADVTTLAAAAKSKFPRLDIAVATPGLNIPKTFSITPRRTLIASPTHRHGLCGGEGSLRQAAASVKENFTEAGCLVGLLAWISSRPRYSTRSSSRAGSAYFATGKIPA